MYGPDDTSFLFKLSSRSANSFSYSLFPSLLQVYKYKVIAIEEEKVTRREEIRKREEERGIKERKK